MTDTPASIDGVCLILVIRTIAIQAAITVAIDNQETDRRSIGQLLVDPGNCVAVFRCETRQRLGLHVKQAHVRGAADFARQAQATIDRYRRATGTDANTAAEKQLDFLRIANRKLSGVFQEERSFFREEQAEPVEIHLLFVDLNLCKVGVIGGIKCQARR